MVRSQARRAGSAAQLAAGVTSYALGVPVGQIMGDERGAATTAFARQVAMYLTHVAFELSLAHVAAAFSRDRSTAAHACHVIEDRRDDDSFDLWIGALETMLREAPAPSEAMAGAEARS